MCIYAYTNQVLDINSTYTNGNMYKILVDKIRSRNFKRNFRKNYYFLVLNKNNPKDIIINSIKGLEILTSNLNNLHFQICWNKNRQFKYKNIIDSIRLFIDSITRAQMCWKEIFLTEIRKINI